jgi:hypothetical protein
LAPPQLTIPHALISATFLTILNSVSRGALSYHFEGEYILTLVSSHDYLPQFIANEFHGCDVSQWGFPKHVRNASGSLQLYDPQLNDHLQFL